MDKAFVAGKNVIVVKQDKQIDLGNIFDTFLFVEFFEDNFSKSFILDRLYRSGCFYKCFSVNEAGQYFFDDEITASLGVFFCNADWLINSIDIEDEDTAMMIFEDECEKSLTFVSKYNRNEFNSYCAVCYNLKGQQTYFLDELIGSEDEVLDQVFDYFGLPDSSVLEKSCIEKEYLSSLFIETKSHKDFLVDVCKGVFDGEFITIDYNGKEMIFYLEEIENDLKQTLQQDVKFSIFYSNCIYDYLNNCILKL